MENEIHGKIYDIYAWKHDFDGTASTIFSSLFDLIQERSKITIFTTNYDKSVEEYCGLPERNLKCIDGFVPRGGYNVWEGHNADSNENDGKRKVFLYKLHGSLDWTMHKKHGPIRTGVERMCTSVPNHDHDLLIYPTLSKNNAEYNKLFTKIFTGFENELRIQDVCVVVGFSFHDEMIRNQFMKFVEAGKKLIIIDPNPDTNFRHVILGKSQDCDQEQSKQNIHHIQMELSVDSVDSIINQINESEYVDNSS